MNYINFAILCVAVFTSLCEAFFLLKAKTEPIFFCIKVCPLYCSPRTKRSSDIYIDHDDESYPWHDIPDDVDWPHHFNPYYYCKPHSTTTTTEPTTTTEEPTYICQLCRDKCHYPPKRLW